MAELPKDIRRVGGSMESYRRPAGPRRLLPAEAELCNALGIEESDYWGFVDLIQLHRPTRPSEYDLVPNIVNDPVSTFLGTKAGAIVANIVIGISINYIASLLAPKPRSKTAGTSLRTEDNYGSRAYAPQSGFNSVQELAALGSAIPLIFTKQHYENSQWCGGIRVNSQLLWSQFLSQGSSQQLKILALFSHGPIASPPDFDGYAIGDLILSSYNKSKIALYFRSGDEVQNNRITIADKYPQGTLSESSFKTIEGVTDPFSIEFPVTKQYSGYTQETTVKALSGASNPTTQATFGLYSSMPNGNQYKLPFEFIMELRGMSPQTIKDTYKKQRKNATSWPTRSGLIEARGLTGDRKDVHVIGGHTLTYEVSGTEQENLETNEPWKVEDIKSAIRNIREDSDATLSIGESYMIGTALARLDRIVSDPNSPGKTWETGIKKTYHFVVVEAGNVDTINLENHLNNPVYSGSVQSFTEDKNSLYSPHEIYVLQKCAIATVTNTRECDVTEIGLKSKVNKQINGQNINSHPDSATIQRFWEDRASISLGSIQRNISRFSFFKLQVKQGDFWYTLSNESNTHSGLFCIVGKTPQDQFNYLSIRHPQKGQYVYRLLPWPGNDVAKNCVGETPSSSKRVNILNASYSEDNDAVKSFDSNGFSIRFIGRDDVFLTADRVSNAEWVQDIGQTLSLVENTGPVISLNRTDTAGQGQPLVWPTETGWVDSPVSGLYSPAYYFYPVGPTAAHYKNVTLVTTAKDARGVTYWNFYINSFHRGPNLGSLVNGTVWGEDIDTIWFKPRIGNYRYRPYEQVRTTHPEDPTMTLIQYSVLAQVQQEVPAGDDFNGIVYPTQGSGTGLALNLRVVSNATGYVAQWSINAPGDGYKDGETVIIPAQTGSSHGHNFPATPIQITVDTATTSETGSTLINNLNPYDKIIDFPQYYEGDTASNKNSPEHYVCYVNQITEPDETGPANYMDLAFAGLRLNSSKEWNNFSQFSAYFKEGIVVERLIDGGEGPTNLFPEIAYALLTDPKIGAGSLIGVESVNKEELTYAAKFCRNNGFYWDGMISTNLNLREFLYEMSGYMFLDFTVIGGRFSLKPTVPHYVDSNGDPGEIKNADKPQIKALFSDGNISDLQVSFLSPEERQLFKAVVMYRQEVPNRFAETKTITVQLNRETPYGSVLPVERFDLSGFCTSRDHARRFARYAIKTRQLVDHGLTFKTSPQNCVGLIPGDYFRLVSEVSHTSRFSNGAITDTGEVVTREPITSATDIYYWKPGSTQVLEGVLHPTVVSQAYWGSLFTRRNATTENRVYKVESISYTDEGLVEIAGSFVPLTSSGSLAVLDWFMVEGNPSSQEFVETDSAQVPIGGW